MSKQRNEETPDGPETPARRADGARPLSPWRSAEERAASADSTPRTGRARTIVAWLLAMVLPTLAAMWAGASLNLAGPDKWEPMMADLAVYREAARVLLEGGDFYHLVNTFPYIYPPIAAVLAIPLTWLGPPGPQLAWCLVCSAMLLHVLHRLGIRRAWLASLIATALFCLDTPFHNVMQLGQLGVLLLWLVVTDMVPPRGRPADAPEPWWKGVGVGLATGLKLTPAVFAIYWFVTGRRRQAYVAFGTFCLTVVIGLLVSPTHSAGYWVRLAGGDSGANPDAFGWIYNISVQSATQRFLGVEGGAVPGVVLSALLVVLSLVAAVAAHRRGSLLLAIGLIGIGSSFANPITWGHHLTWVLLLGLAMLDRRVPRRLKFVLGVTILVLCVNPQTTLGGGPWAHREIFEYSIAQKWYAALPDLMTALLAVVVLLPWRPKGGSNLESRRIDDEFDQSAAATEPDRGAADELASGEQSSSTTIQPRREST